MSDVALPRPLPRAESIEAARTRSLPRSLVVAAAIAFVAFLVAAAAFRVWNLDRIGLNSDESVYTGQAATLFGDPELSRYFSPFRAHPLFLQTGLALLFHVTGVSDLAARLFVALGFGVVGVAITALLGRRLYGGAVALIGAAALSLMPYHVLLSRQVMLDVPVALFLTLTAWSTYNFAVTAQRKWWLLSAFFLGLAVLTKETAIFMGAGMALFLLWSRVLRTIRTRDALQWVGLFALTVAPFVLTRLLFGGPTTGGYFFYQALRDPNHEWWYFPVVFWEFVTPPLTIAMLGGVVLMLARRNLADKLLLSWVVVLGVFFQAWPTKLFPYAIALAPALVIAAAEFLVASGRTIASRLPRLGAAVAALAALVVLVPLVPSSARVISMGTEDIQGPFKADVEVQDFAGSREAARWIGEHTPQSSVFLTIGPSVGNIVSFYGHRDWYALSVSPDPNRRNPAYRPIPNPDLAIRRFEVHYAVWDFYSADRSAFYNRRLNHYVSKFNGIPVFSVWVENGQVRSGRVAPEGVDKRLVIYDLVGGNPLPPPPEVSDP